MRKLFTLLMLLFLWAGSSWGQISTYTFSSSSGTYTALSSETVLWSASFDDNSSTAITIPSMTVDGTPYTTMFVQANGWITLGGSSISTSYVPISNSTSYPVVISAFGRDLNNGASGAPKISYNTNDGGDIVVQFQDVRRYNVSGELLSFQIRLTPASGVIRFIYGGTITAGNSTSYPQVGLRGATNTIYNNRTTTTDWAATTAGATNGATCTYSATVLPAVGLTFTFTPPVILDPPNCATLVSPADAATNVLPSAALNWASGGGAPTGYNLYFGADELPATPIDLGLVTTYDPAGNMDYSTTYYWKVVPYNDNGDATDCATWSFTTGPDPTVTVFPFTEGFEGAAFPPYGWTNIKTAGTGTPGIWDRQTTGTNPTCTPHSGEAMARYNCFSLSSGTKGELSTPSINFTSDNYRVTFWMYRDGGYPSTADLVNIYYNTTNSSTGATLLGTINRAIGLSPIENAAGWYEYRFNMPAGASGNGRYIIFEAVSGYGNNIFIDDITLEEIPETTLTWYNLQYPGAATIIADQNEAIYAQCYEDGVTNLPGAGTGIECWIGYSTDNTNPSTWTNWIAATYNVDAGNNDEYTINLGVAQGLLPGTYYYASRFSYLSGPYTYGGYNIGGGGTWDGTNNLSGVLTVNPVTIAALPHSENFDAVTAPAIPPGWTALVNSTSSFAAVINSTSGAYSAPNNISLYNSDDAAADLKLITPAIVPSLSNARIKFIARGGTGYTVIVGTMDSPTGTFTPIETVNITGTNTEYTVSLEGYSGSDTYIAFQHGLGGTYRTIYIDNFLLEEIPSTPVFAIAPESWDFGDVGLGEESVAKVFTISNSGPGTLSVSAPALDNNIDFTLSYTPEDYPAELTGTETVTFSIVFHPQSEGAATGEVSINYDDTEAVSTVTLTGNGIIRPAGSTCGNPYPITLPLVDFSGNTSTMGDDYSSTWITPSSLYMNGDDMVFEFTLTEAGYLGGSMTTTDSYLGLFILEDCPDPVAPAAVLRSATSSGTSVTLTEILLQPGTYFAIVSSWPSPQSIEFILNLSFEPLPDCPTPTALTATPASFSAELGWTENGTATLWDIEWGEAGFTPGEGTVITGVSNPYTLTGLEFSTPYDFYVRADCGEGSVSDWSVVKNFTTLAACPAPSVLTATSITATSAVLGWTENGSATSWDIEYGQTPFTPTGTPTISGVTNPYSLTGLSSGITYAYYVRAYCDETYQSTWSGPLTFTTQTVVPAPYTEGFITTSTPTGWTTTGWSIGSVRGATGNPGNNIYRNLWSSATTGTFTTVNVGPVASGMSLTFDYQLTNYDSPYDPPAEGSGNFIVSVSTDFGLNYTELETTDNDGEAGWRSKSYDLSAYAGSNIKVRIVGNRTSGDYDLAFDNFYIGLPITCPAPTDVIATAVTQTSATISWTAPDPAPANGYEYEVRNDGDPGSGATGLAASGTTAAGVTSADITGLEDGTDYMIYVRSVCGTENYSNWAEGSFFTPCDVIIAPFIETVEEGELSPCWTIGTSGDGSWFLSSAASGYGIGLRSFIAPFYAISDPSPFDLYTPEFDASALVNPQLEFDFAYATYTGGEVDQLDVLYSTDGGATYSLLLAMPGGEDGILNTGGALSGSFVPSASQWETQVLALPAGTNRIAFRGISDWGNNLYIDNVKIVSAPVTSKTLNLKAYIQGFWNGSAMNQAQDVDQDENIFNKFSGTTVDTLSVYLAEADAPWAYLYAAHEVNINTDGSMVISVPAAFSGSYYIVIDHHSSVETWSALPVDFSGTTIDYDFTTAAGQAYGSNQKSMGTVWALYSGDVGNDEYIEFLDVVPVYNLSVAGFFGYSLFDLDGSGYIEFLDYIIAYNNSVNGVGMNTPPNPAKRPGLLKLKLTD